MNPKFHISLDVKDLQQSIGFYSLLFGMQPTKVKPDYAKFDADAPGVVLTLEKGDPCCITGMTHMGIRVDSTEAVLQAKARFEAAGYATAEEKNTDCCYAVQDKVWVTDPTGYRWEVYTFKGDSEGAERGSACCTTQHNEVASACCSAEPANTTSTCCSK